MRRFSRRKVFAGFRFWVQRMVSHPEICFGNYNESGLVIHHFVFLAKMMSLGECFQS